MDRFVNILKLAIFLFIMCILFLHVGATTSFSVSEDGFVDIEGDYSSFHPSYPPTILDEVSEILVTNKEDNADWSMLIEGLVEEISQEFTGAKKKKELQYVDEIRVALNIPFSTAIQEAGWIDETESFPSIPSVVSPPVTPIEKEPVLPSKWQGAVVNSIEFLQKEGRSYVVVSTDSPVQYDVLLLSKPDRLVLDLMNSMVSSDIDDVKVNDEIIKNIRFGQFNPEVARIVMDLENSVGYDISRNFSDPKQIIVTFNSRVNSLSYNGGQENSIDIYTSGPVEYTSMMLKAPDRIVIDLHESTLVSPTKNIPVDQGVVRDIRIEQFDSNTVRVVVDLLEPIAYKILRSPTQDGLLKLMLNNSVRAVEVASSKTGSDIIIKGNGNLKPSIEFDEVSRRLFVDIPDAIMESQMKVIMVGDGLVDRITAIQADDTTVQLAVALNSYAGHEVKRSENNGEVVLKVFNSPLRNKLVAIDPGHGGTDPGAVGPTGLYEKTVNLDIAKRLERLLKIAGAEVLLTRNDDSDVYLPKRVEIVHNAKADIFVSIHSNGVTQYYPSGTEAYYYSNPTMSKKLADYINKNIVNDLDLINRGVKRKDYYVIKGNKMPSVLIEVAFITNLNEEKLLKEPLFREKVAQSIYKGIVEYFSEE